MQILFKYLSFIKTKVNKGNKKVFFALLVMSIALGCGVSIIVDILLPWNFIFTTIRSIVALCVGFITFTFAYSIIVIKKQKEDKVSKLAWLNDLSFQQRVNLSLIVVGILSILFLVLIPTQSPYYTFIAGLLLSVVVWAVYYTKPTPDEIEAYYVGLEDMRDKKGKV